MRRLAAVAVGVMCACSGMVQAASQDATLPPAAQHAVLTVEGRGVQIYSCMRTSGSRTSAGAEWVFVAPAARLFDKDGIEVGTHGDGPVWHLQDGSSVLGKVIAKTPSPDAGSVPWLLVKAIATTGTGTLVGVEFIRRSETKGGAVPGPGCDEGHLGDMVRVPYTTMYTFYSAR